MKYPEVDCQSYNTGYVFIKFRYYPFLIKIDEIHFVIFLSEIEAHDCWQMTCWQMTCTNNKWCYLLHVLFVLYFESTRVQDCYHQPATVPRHVHRCVHVNDTMIIYLMTYDSFMKETSVHTCSDFSVVIKLIWRNHQVYLHLVCILSQIKINLYHVLSSIISEIQTMVDINMRMLMKFT